MERFKQLIPFFVIFALIIMGLVCFQILNASASSGIENTVDNAEIIKAMEKGYEAIHYASQTNDPSKLSEVFVDTTDFKSSKEVKSDVEKVLGSKVAERTGYLTAMETKFILRGRTDKKMKVVLEKAKTENRKITKEEWKEIIEENNGQVPPTIYNDPDAKTQLIFKEIEVNGDRAIVFYDDGAAYQKATLLKINNRWFISNIEPINIHF